MGNAQGKEAASKKEGGLFLESLAAINALGDSGEKDLCPKRKPRPVLVDGRKNWANLMRGRGPRRAKKNRPAQVEKDIMR